MMTFSFGFALFGFVGELILKINSLVSVTKWNLNNYRIFTTPFSLPKFCPIRLILIFLMIALKIFGYKD